MNPKVKIGEMAKLHNISSQTLRYYDNIGLFKPMYMDSENNYRFYGVEQFADLDSILFLKNLGLSLEEIRSYLKHKDLNNLVTRLEKKEQEIKAQIEVLKNKLLSINEKVDLIREYNEKEDFNKCKLKKLPSRKVVRTNFYKDRDKVEFEYGIKELSNIVQDELSLFNGLIAIVIDENNLKNYIYDEWKGVSLFFKEKEKLSKDVEVLPEGDFATIVFKGSYGKGKEDYIKLLNWINEKSYEIVGDGYFLTITDAAFSEFEEEYITEIQIPIKKS